MLSPHSVQLYLTRELGFTSRGGRVYCSYDLLGTQGERVFLETACEEFLVGPDSLESGSGGRIPVALVLDTRNGVHIIGHDVPGDGGAYRPDVERIFPAAIARRILDGRPAAELREANRQRAATPGAAEPAAPSDPRAAVFEKAATDLIAFLRGEALMDDLWLADTVVLYLSPEGGGASRAFARDQLREPADWVVESGTGTYSFVPPPPPRHLTTRYGRHLNCQEYALTSLYPDLAERPHVGVLLTPRNASSCLQTWNVTFVFDAKAQRPTLVAAVYDQWEW